MLISHVRVKLVDNGLENKSRNQLLGFAEIVLDNCLAVHDLRIIKGCYGEFVAMPDRKIKINCSSCDHKNEVLAFYCNSCGCDLSKIREEITKGESCRECRGYGGDCPKCAGSGRVRYSIHLDIVHPTNIIFRRELQKAVIKEYREELSRIQLRSWKDVDAMIIKR